MGERPARIGLLRQFHQRRRSDSWQPFGSQSTGESWLYPDTNVRRYREVSKLLPVGTIVLVYDKVSFVSAKPWVENPKLKQAALLKRIHRMDRLRGGEETRRKPLQIKKPAQESSVPEPSRHSDAFGFAAGCEARLAAPFRSYSIS